MRISPSMCNEQYIYHEGIFTQGSNKAELIQEHFYQLSVVTDKLNTGGKAGKQLWGRKKKHHFPELFPFGWSDSVVWGHEEIIGQLNLPCILPQIFQSHRCPVHPSLCGEF